MIVLENEAKEIIIRDVMGSYPGECFGFMFGYDDGNDRRIITHAMTIDKSKELSPQDYRQAEQYAAAQGLQLVGVYHSHPDRPAVPSEHDRVAAQRFFSYLVVSVNGRQVGPVRSWRLNEDGNFEEENNHLLA